MTEIIQQLIDLLKEMAPNVWAVLVKQAQLEAISHLAWGILCPIGMFVALSIARYAENAYKQDRYSSWDVVVVLAYFGAVVLLIVGIAELLTAFRWFANPDFYAIHVLLRQLGQGQ